jgi:DNA-binding MarR family transcriptional regulator
MPFLLLKDLPRYECLIEGAKEFPELDPSACEAYLNLLRTGDEVYGVVERYLSEHHISQGRFSVLMLLWRTSQMRNGEVVCGENQVPRTPASLADAAGVTRATMTGLIDTLERDGLVRREPDPNDRRMMSVELTSEGESFIKGMLPGHFRLMAQLMEPLSETERKTMVGLLHKVLRHAPNCTTGATSASVPN